VLSTSIDDWRLRIDDLLMIGEFAIAPFD